MELLDWFLHIDKKLPELIVQYDVWVYAILFLIIFIETGLVIMPFLPGDSLLFAAGMICAGETGGLNFKLLLPLLIVGAILGDTLNYHIGKWLGPKVFTDENKYINKKHLESTQAFYEKYGGLTIIIARFMPFARTFAPFVAGIGSMQYSKFILFNIIGGVLWVSLFLTAGYLFGNIPFVQHNFKYVVLAIIGISVLPVVYQFVKTNLQTKQNNQVLDHE